MKKSHRFSILAAILLILFSCSEYKVTDNTMSSFPAGTPVLTPSGDVAIEDFTPGMMVTAYSVESGQWLSVPVIDVIRDSYSGILIRISTDRGSLQVTAGHPVFVVDIPEDQRYRPVQVAPDSGWIQAGSLQPEDRILMPDGNSARILSINQKNVEGMAVYDLITASAHTFAAGEPGFVVSDGTVTITRSGRYYSGSRGGGCFPSGTEIITSAGPAAIETINAGDTVKTFDAQSGLWAEREVTELFQHSYSGDWILINSDDIGLEVSGNHPFLLVSGMDYASRPDARDVPAEERAETPYGRWVEARHLKPGDVLLSMNGRNTKVTDLTVSIKEATVYNISVESMHTYAVGPEGFLVHNKGQQAEASTGAVEKMTSEEPLPPTQPRTAPPLQFSTEEYDRIYEQRFLETISNPLSTLSIDVDTAAYSNVRRFIQNGDVPNPDAVRIEEFINYFTYEYPEPDGQIPFAFHTELSLCPWQEDHALLHVGLQGRKVLFEELPPNNLVFLLDVSGSMSQPNKLPLLKQSLAMLLDEMRDIDTVSIVVYAGAAGLVLPPTPCSEKRTILNALNRLQSGGSTAGGAGIKLAYKTAVDNFIPSGNNRVILGTDGDFNVGQSSDAELVRLIEQNRDQGVFLTILGFGMGNYKDSKMEKLSNAGNGNYAYIDTLREARKVLVREISGTLFAIAGDVKIQIEFNPAVVSSYRLVGYENRLLSAEDFADDKKDAGEMGAGHTVTVLYELILSDDSSQNVADLRYQTTEVKDSAEKSEELMFLKFRYKLPDQDSSSLVEQPVKYEPVALSAATEDFRFAAAVAEFGLLLRDSEYKGNANYEQVLALAETAMGFDPEGDRREFLGLVKLAQWLKE